MKAKNYRILLTIWIALILFFLGQFLCTSLFQTVYPTLMDKLYAITSFMWKYFLSIMTMSLFTLIPPFDPDQKDMAPSREEEIEPNVEIKDSPETIDGLPISKRAKVVFVSIMIILAFFLIRHVILVNVYANYYLVVWNFIYTHIFISLTSVLLHVLVLYFSFKNTKIADVKNEI
jgi:hypothetical protein